MTTVRAGRPEDREHIATMLGRAFIDDPAMAFIFPDRGERARRLPLLFRQIYASDCRTGAVMTTAEAEAATLWRSPGRVATPVLEHLAYAKSYLTALGGALVRALKLSHAIEAHMPKGEYWYLHVAGCDPAAQGKGFGRAVLQAGLERAVGSQACYLETGTERNLGLYRSLGFEVTGEWSVSGGPKFWSMLRPKA